MDFACDMARLLQPRHESCLPITLLSVLCLAVVIAITGELEMTQSPETMVVKVRS